MVWLFGYVNSCVSLPKCWMRSVFLPSGRLCIRLHVMCSVSASCYVSPSPVLTCIWPSLAIATRIRTLTCNVGRWVSRGGRWFTLILIFDAFVSWP